MIHVASSTPAPPLAADCADRLRLWHPRFQPCAICLRPAQGFGFFDPNKGRPRDYRWFCSMPCQGLYATRFKKGRIMIGMTEEERLAIALVMKRLGQTMEDIGWQKRLCDLSETDVKALIEEILEGYGAEMARIAKTQEVPF